MLTSPHSVGDRLATSSRARLTGRGWALLGIGAAGAAVAYVGGQIDVTRVAVFFLLLPILAWAYLTVSHGGWSASRRVKPHITESGHPVTIELEISRERRGPAMLLSDNVPAAVGGDERLLVDTLTVKRFRTTYRRTPTRRGVWAFGPLSAESTDPLRLVARSWTVDNAQDVVVLPTVVPVTVGIAGGGAVSGGSGVGEGVAVTGEPDITVRGFRPGDGLRRIHWRSTARRGDLMVRNTRHHSPASAVIVVDTRISAHTPDSPTSTLEWVLSAAASIVDDLAHRNCHLHLLGCGEPLAVDPGDEASIHAAWEMLARVTPRDGVLHHDLTMASAIRGATHAIVLAGAIDASDVAGLTGCAQYFHQGCIAFAGVPSLSADGTTLSSEERTARLTAQATAMQTLSDAGWRTTEAAPGEPVEAALARWSTAAAPRRRDADNQKTI